MRSRAGAREQGQSFTPDLQFWILPHIGGVMNGGLYAFVRKGFAHPRAGSTRHGSGRAIRQRLEFQRDAAGHSAEHGAGQLGPGLYKARVGGDR